MSRFESLLDAETFADDVLMRVSTERAEVWVPEQLMHRLLAAGRAYGLHVLMILSNEPLHEPVWINNQQAAALLEEVEFMRILLVKDAAIQALIASVAPVVAEAARYGGGNALVLEGQ